MIFVSGTKRSGTSMWMQIFRAAGFPALGDAFPRNWGGALREVNPDGFYETALRQGVYYRTNPHPKTGKYFLPEDVDGYAVKVFIPGVVRSERAYITKLVANIRAWREYEASIQRLYAVERASNLKKDPEHQELFHFPPALEWWMENFALIRDLSLRRYPARLQAYGRVVEAPERVIPKVLGWIGSGDVDAAIAAVKPEHRTQVDVAESDAVDAALARVFDDLYDAVREGKGITGALLKTLNKTNQEMIPRLMATQKKVVDSQRRAAAEAKKRGKPRAKPLSVTGLPKTER